MELIALVTVLIAIEYFYLAIMVGKARGETGVAAPTCAGEPKFERVFRVQQNTMEQLIIFYPALWIFGYYVHAEIGAALGVLFLIGRIMYARGYVQSPDKRGPGFILGSLALAILLIGDLLILGITLI
jgi:glutathione S-transferase